MSRRNAKGTHQRALDRHNEAWERWRRARRSGQPPEVVAALREELLVRRRFVSEVAGRDKGGNDE